MQYQGGKGRIAKKLVELIELGPGQCWVEPFVGGGGVISLVKGPRIGSDVDPYTIQALTSIRDSLDSLPKSAEEFSEADYKALKHTDHPHKGYLGYALSYGGKWMGGWSRNRRGDDYVRQAYNSAKRQSPKLQGVDLRCCDYRELDIPPNSLIYCDPPYAQTTGYRVKFDSDEFWGWASAKAKQGHSVWVSEYYAPPCARLIWSAPQANSMNYLTVTKAVECLYKVEV